METPMARLAIPIIIGVTVAGVAGAAAFIQLTRPDPLPEDTFAGITGDPAKGERVFWASGCASCHMAPGAQGDAKLVLSGGQRLESPLGTFVVPNISTDASHGIGGWSLQQFGNAVMRGVSPENDHYYPALPYPAYRLMAPQDVADLKAYMDTLPPSDRADEDHEIPFPFSIRRGIGLWKLVNLRDDWTVAGTLPEPAARGRYIAEAQAHCAECHTPRDITFGLQRGRWLAGAPNPSGEGRVPNITPAALDWTEAEIANYLRTGFTPDYDVVGGTMAHVVDQFARLPESYATDVAAYLKAVPPAQ